MRKGNDELQNSEMLLTTVLEKHLSLAFYDSLVCVTAVEQTDKGKINIFNISK